MKRTLISLVVALATTGCATIIQGESQTMIFKSVPDAASISISNRAGEKIHTGTTPVTLSLKRGAGYFKPESYVVRVSKDGYESVDIAVAGTVNGWYIGNILFGGLIGMLIVDPLTGAMYTLEPNEVTSELVAIKKTEADGALVIALKQDMSDAQMKAAKRIN